jgi:methionine aminopeptidase
MMDGPCLHSYVSCTYLVKEKSKLTCQSGARSAQFEHQVLITEDGVEVMTR